MRNTGYPYSDFEEMYPETRPTPEWYGFGHKNYAFSVSPVRHLILSDGQEHAVIDVSDPNDALGEVVSDRLRGQPLDRPHFPASPVLTLVPTARPGARPGMESGQFQMPDTRPAVILHHAFGRTVEATNPHATKRGQRRRR